jgi:hypothetical protein
MYAFCLEVIEQRRREGTNSGLTGGASRIDGSPRDF